MMRDVLLTVILTINPITISTISISSMLKPDRRRLRRNFGADTLAHFSDIQLLHVRCVKTGAAITSSVSATPVHLKDERPRDESHWTVGRPVNCCLGRLCQLCHFLEN